MKKTKLGRPVQYTETRVNIMVRIGKMKHRAFKLACEHGNVTQQTVLERAIDNAIAYEDAIRRMKK